MLYSQSNQNLITLNYVASFDVFKIYLLKLIWFFFSGGNYAGLHFGRIWTVLDAPTSSGAVLRIQTVNRHGKKI